MKKIQEIEFNGMTVYIEVDDMDSNQTNYDLPFNEDVADVKETVEKITLKASEIVLEPALLFATQLNNSIKKMVNKPQKANIEFFVNIYAQTNGIVSVVAKSGMEASLKVNLGWEIGDKTE